MNYITKEFDDLCIKAEISIFKSQEKVSESHIVIYYKKSSELKNDFSTQVKEINNCLHNIISTDLRKKFNICFKRYFLNDIENQIGNIEQEEKEAIYPVSIIQQPHLPNTRIAVWVYLVSVENIEKADVSYPYFQNNGYSHYWLTNLYNEISGIYNQTTSIFQKIEEKCNIINCTIKDNCIRTWLFIKNIDMHYKDVVEARNDYFNTIGLTRNTHYIASTGIEGKYSAPGSGVMIDAYIVKGLQDGQVSFLNGQPNMNPTNEYGVAFERGTVIDYGDRRHIFISGTASINNKGEIVAPGNIIKQTERALENVSVLLREAGASLTDLAHLIVYLRNFTDYQTVKNILKNHCKDVPLLVLYAPVCRPAWLVELEGIAILQQRKKEFNDF